MALVYSKQISKKRKPNAKQRELAAEWQAILKKYEPTKKVKPKDTTLNYKLSPPPGRETSSHIRSLDTGYHSTALKEIPKYTGTAMIGIGTLHKSNAVPLFSTDDAKEQARMRRG
jgi:hypothetical protein